jgi:hypothetical protein
MATPPSRDIHYSRNFSTAPLPLIPRRHTSAPSSRRVCPVVAPLTDPPTSGMLFAHASPPTIPFSDCTSAPVHVHPPTPPSDTKARQSSTVSFPLAPSSPAEPVNQPIPPRRFRGQRVPAIRPPEQSTPTPAKADSNDDTPSALRKSAAVILTRNLSESHVHALAAAAVARSEPLPLFPRKKSGEPLKSSLKAKRTPTRGSLTVITDPASLSSRSAPTTPGHKGVRFDSQLEHVKLFLAEQKPLAVSRDGSPTDTSGTDSEFPPFIYARDDDLKERPLVMHRIDVPIAPPLAEDTRDVAIENIELVGTTIEGIVRVRNLAFEKWIAVRFTLDKWQTTSEVTARYKESVPDSIFDRFMFAIKLADVLSRAEEKTLYLAIRYSVAGREIWDNNSGRNYQVRVVREKAPKANKEVVKEAVVEIREVSSQADDIADLRRKLEQVVKHGPSETIGGILAQHSRRRWQSPSPTPSPPRRDATPNFRSEGSLAARYDFAASLRTPWRAPVVPKTPSHARTNTYPSAGPNSVQWPHSLHGPCGSPRDKPEVSYFPELDLDCDRDSDDPITLVPSLRRRNSSSSGSRNHTRGGTIELSHAPGVKRTPPTSPYSSPAPLPLPLSAPTSARPHTQPYVRFNSFPPHSSPKQQPQLQTQDSCEEGTPSITSSSSSRSPSPSPSLSPAEPVSPTRLMPPGLDIDEKSNTPLHHLDYHNFVNRYVYLFYWMIYLDVDSFFHSYCFFTGSGPDGVLEHPDFIPRSLSASSIEEFLSAGQSPPLGGSPYSSSSPFATPRAHGRAHGTASDDELQRSGSATPTGPTMRRLPHTPPTPLLF